MSILDWEIIEFEDIVVFLLLWLSMGKGYDKEILFKFCYFFIFFHDGRKHIVLSFSLPYTHLLYRLAVTEDVIPLHSLTLIANHVAFNFSLILCLSWFYYSCHVFTYLPLRMLWMPLFIFLLHLSCHFYFPAAHIRVMLYRGVNPTNSLNSK